MQGQIWLRLAAAVSLSLFASTTLAAPKVALFAGGDDPTSTVAAKAQLHDPFGIDFDAQGNAYICEMKGQRVVRVDPQGNFSVVAGTGKIGFRGDGGPARDAEFNNMHSLVVLPGGDLLVADTTNHRVRKIDAATRTIATIVGADVEGFSGDGGPALKAQFGGIYCAALDLHGNRLILTDLDNRRIRAVDNATGIVTTIAGNGQRGRPDDGAAATRAPLVDPRAACVDSRGNLYVLERGGHALRVVAPDGAVRTVAGTGKAGFSGDGGPALRAELNGPKHLCCDDQDNVLIADCENHVIRRYQPRDGVIVRVAGTGRAGSDGIGGDPLEVELDRPHGVYFHAERGLFIVDSENDRLLRIDER